MIKEVLSYRFNYLVILYLINWLYLVHYMKYTEVTFLRFCNHDTRSAYWLKRRTDKTAEDNQVLLVSRLIFFESI